MILKIIISVVLRTKKELSEIYNKAIEEGTTFVVYVGSEKVEINSEHNIDYYDEKIAF